MSCVWYLWCFFEEWSSSPKKSVFRPLPAILQLQAVWISEQALTFTLKSTVSEGGFTWKLGAKGEVEVPLAAAAPPLAVSYCAYLFPQDTFVANESGSTCMWPKTFTVCTRLITTAWLLFLLGVCKYIEESPNVSEMKKSFRYAYFQYIVNVYLWCF